MVRTDALENETETRWVNPENGPGFANEPGPAAAAGGSAGPDVQSLEEKLRASELRFRALANSVPSFVWSATPDGTITWANAQWYDYTGLTLAETANDWPRLVFHPEDYDRGTCKWKTALALGMDYENEVRLRRRDGHYRWFLSRAVPVHDADQRISGWVGSTTDIHDRKLAEEALRLREEHYRQLLRAGRDALFVYRVSDDGAPEPFVEVNDEACRRYGYSREEFLARTVTEITTLPEDQLRAALRQLLKDGEGRWEVMHRTRDGRLIPTEVNCQAVTLEGAPHIILSARDITERKRDEAELFNSRQMLRMVLDTIPQRVFWKDRNSVYVGCNQALAEDCGFREPGELIGKTDYETASRATADAFRTDDRRVITTGRPKLDYEELQIKPDGNQAWLRTSKVPLHDKDGQVIGVLGTYEDITEHKRAEEDLRDAQEKLSRINEELEHRVQERTASLCEAVNQMEEFSYSVSHDLRAPIRAMHGFAAILLEKYRDQFDATGRDYLERIVQSGERMDRLIHDILAFSRVARCEIHLTPVSLKKLVHEIVEQCPAIQTSHAQMSVGDLSDVIAHEPSLAQAVSNLIGNAIKFVAPGVAPHVRIWTEEVAVGEHRETSDDSSGSPSLRFVRLWISDNGIGIRPEHQVRLFRMFERIYPEKRYEGTGIGLAIVRKALERMGGTFGVKSDGVNGSGFWIQLPGVGQ